MLTKPFTSTVRSRDLGARCVLAREQAGLTVVDLAYSLGVPDSSLMAFEQGQRHVPDILLVPYLTQCGLRSPEVMPYFELAHGADTGYHVVPFDEGVADDLPAVTVHETTALGLTEYAPTVVPALLQISTYTEALLAARGHEAEDIARHVQARGQRQAALKPGSEPAATFYVSERTLRLPVASPAVMCDQLLYLAAAQQDGRAVVRVVPDDHVAYIGSANGFRLLRYAEHGPVAMEELLVAVVLVDKTTAMPEYERVVARLGQLALTAEQSRLLLSELVDEYGRLAA